MIHVVAIFALSALFAAPSAAHVGETIYPIYELPTSQLPDLHDGSLADWEAALPGASLDFNDFESLPEVGDGAPINPDDLAYRFFLAWHGDSGRIYVAFERIDDAYVNEYAGGAPVDLWKYDSFEILVDGDHSGGYYQGFKEDAARLTESQAQQYVVVAQSRDGKPMSMAPPPSLNSRSFAWVSQPPYGDAGGAVVEGAPVLSINEVYVTPFDDLNLLEPERSVRSILVAGNIIGFQLSVADFDAAPFEYHGFYTLAGQAGTWRTADLFVDGLLVGCDTQGCGPAPPASAVMADSWGRIKATLGRGGGSPGPREPPSLVP